MVRTIEMQSCIADQINFNLLEQNNLQFPRRGSILWVTDFGGFNQPK